MSAMDDVFGTMPQRPTSEEFWRLCEMVLQLDGRIEAAPTQEEKNRLFEESVTKFIGMEEVTYLALQRAFRAIGVVSRRDLLEHAAEVRRCAALWLEAFAMGCEWKRRNPSPLKP